MPQWRQIKNVSISSHLLSPGIRISCN